MHDNVKLPEVIEGKWIWHTNQKQSDCDRLLLRQDFTILEMPGVAELWVSSHSFFQIFLNGRPCAAGPIPHPGAGRGAYAMRIDVTHMLEVGCNHLGICAHQENTPLAGVRHSVDGIWLQINVDGKAVAWTDENWLCLRPESAYIDTGLRMSPCDVFLEHVDLRHAYPDWQNQDIQSFPLVSFEHNGEIADEDLEGKWTWVDISRPPSPSMGSLEPFDHVPSVPEWYKFKEISCRGSFKQARDATWISFANAIELRGTPGTYVAETNVYCPPGETVTCLCLCDDPYVLFLNGVKLKEQAVPELPLRSAPNAARVQKLRPQEFVDPSIQMELKAGWNQIMFVQECQSKVSGALFIWPDLPPGALQVHQKAAFSSPIGWYVAGPLSVPMALIYPSFPFSDMIKYPFVPADNPPNDIGAYYLASVFEPSRGGDGLSLPQDLANSEYVVVDFGQILYSFPHVKITGNDGDVIDVICGEHFQNGEVIANEAPNHHNASTLILGGGESEWLCSTPRGLRYMMIVARSVRDRVVVQSVDLWHESQENPNSGSFQSSSPTLDAIWNIGVRTLSAMHRVFMDSPTKDHAQSLPDAMIQSWAAYYVFGGYDKVGRAIETFAKSQFETGELNAISPSGLFQALPDYSLNWPVWLQRHIQHTGDTAFLKRMIPTLQKLLYYYNEMAVSPDGPLDDMHEYLGVYAFIDHGNMDREGISTALNGLYCRALLSASWLVSQAGLPDMAEVYKNRAANVAHQVWLLNWNQKAGLFADSYHDGMQSGSCSWQSNVLAIYGGIARPQNYQGIWNRLFIEDAPFELYAKGEYNNPYFKYYVLETAFALGKSAWALRLIDYYWGGMAKAGAITWWEMFDPGNAAMQGRLCGKCHGYGVSPNAFFISELVGIRPADPGMRMVYFNPMPGDVTWVKASIPTPHGYIMVNWKLMDDGTFNVNISSNYVLEVVPVLAPGIAKQAIFNVSDKVSILAEDQEGKRGT